MRIRYTDGSEFYKVTGEEYKGPYFLDNRNVAYIYREHTKPGDKLIPYFVHNTELVRSRNNHKGGYRTPKPFKPVPTSDDYSRGFIDRYFMQKRTNPKNSIIEVSREDFDNYGASNNFNGINSKIYGAVSLKWAISGKKEYVVSTNKREVDKNQNIFPGLDWFLINFMEFYVGYAL